MASDPISYGVAVSPSQVTAVKPLLIGGGTTIQRGGGLQVLQLTVGQSITFPYAGTTLRVIASSLPLKIRTNGGAQVTGSFSTYTQGMGFTSPVAWSSIDLLPIALQGETTVNVVLYIGFDDFLDVRSYPPGLQYISIATAIPSPAAAVQAIADKSGQFFTPGALVTSLTSGPMLAIFREQLIISNRNGIAGTELAISNSSSASDPSVATVAGATSLQFGVSGTIYVRYVGGGNLDSRVSMGEIYACVAVPVQ